MLPANMLKERDLDREINRLKNKIYTNSISAREVERLRSLKEAKKTIVEARKSLNISADMIFDKRMVGIA